MSLSVTFYGTRGSIPSPGPGTVRYGGNTPCLLVSSPTGEMILDAGTGLRHLGDVLAARGTEGGLQVDILLSHTHWDHIQGLPFFHPLFQAGNRIAVYGPRPNGTSLAAILGQQMDPAVFPIPLSSAQADVDVTEIAPGGLNLPDFDVSAFAACHPGPTLGFAIQHRASPARVIYLTDNELHAVDETGRRPSLVRFLRDADLLVHDATYFASQVEERRGWGHSSAVEAVAIALESGCRRLALFHHYPDHDDRALDQLLAEACDARDARAGSLEIAIAAEGSTLRVEDE